MRAVLLLVVRLAVLVVVLVAGGATFFRFRAAVTTPPVVLEPGLVGEQGSGAWLYAVRTGRGVVLFDAGRDRKGRPVDAALAVLGVQRDQVTDVFLTHGHPEEAAGAAALPRARVHAGAADVEMAAGHQAPGRGLDRSLALLMPAGTARVSDPIPAEEELALGGGERVLAVPVPGHSPGSTAYLFRGVLYVGDALAVEGDRLVPGPRFLSADPERAVRSALALARRASGLAVRRVCAAHGGCTPDGSGRALLERFAALR